MIIDTVEAPALDDALKFNQIERSFIIATMGKVLLEGNPPYMSAAISTIVEKLSEVQPFNLATPNVIVYVSVMTSRIFENPVIRFALLHECEEAKERLKTYGYVLED